MAAMRQGRFADAWRISDAVLRQRAGVPCFHLPRHEQYIWNGVSLAGKRVLVRCYHGLGDTVQFIRYAPLLKAVAREVIVWAQPGLIPLLETADGVDQLLPLHDGTPDIACDADVEVMELPHVFRTTLETIPCAVPYLHAPAEDGFVHGLNATRRRDPGATSPSGTTRFDPDADAAAAHRMTRNIGIVWQSGGWDDRRSVPTAVLEPLARIPGIRLIALQQGSALDEWPPEWGPVGSTPDPRVLAARLRACDLVITVDSFPAHLAGALGVTTWTLLHADPDWRWMDEGERSPWYPTMRLWRQHRAGDWSEVIEAMAAELRRGVSDRALGRSAAG